MKKVLVMTLLLAGVNNFYCEATSGWNYITQWLLPHAKPKEVNYYDLCYRFHSISHKITKATNKMYTEYSRRIKEMKPPFTKQSKIKARNMVEKMVHAEMFDLIVEQIAYFFFKPDAYKNNKANERLTAHLRTYNFSSFGIDSLELFKDIKELVINREAQTYDDAQKAFELFCNKYGLTIEEIPTHSRSK